MSKQKKPQKRQKKSGNQDRTVKTIILITAVLNLIKAIADLISKLTD